MVREKAYISINGEITPINPFILILMDDLIRDNLANNYEQAIQIINADLNTIGNASYNNRDSNALDALLTIKEL